MQNSDPTYIGRRGSRHVPTSSVRPAERRNDKLNWNLLYPSKLRLFDENKATVFDKFC